ncbi:hypothetical protein EMCRGX_G027370 [Ephydatia muelleri]
MDGGTVDHLESCDGMTDDCSTEKSKVLAQLQLSTKSLSEAETKNRELLKQYEDLRAQFLRSEEARKLAEGSCTELLKQSRQQIGVCEELSAKVKSMEATADECNQQRAALKVRESHDILQKKFIEKVQSEAVLSEKCSGLERKLEKKDLIAEEFFQKPGEGSKWRSDSVQFDLTTTYQERKRLKEDILHYENELQRHKEIQNRLNKEVMDLTAKLMSVNSDKKDLLGKLEAAYNRLQYSEEQRSALQGPSFFKCLSLSPFSAVDPGIMLASRILSELSGLMTVRSKAAGRDKDQLGTRTSAGRIRSLQPKLQPFSTSGARPAIWQKCARESRRRLCRAMTNPPCLQVSEWWPIASRAEEQKGHRSVGESKGNSNQNLRRTCISEDPRFKPKLRRWSSPKPSMSLGLGDSS